MSQTHRRLREYRGVTYQEGMWWLRDSAFKTVSSLIAFRSWEFSDKDFPALLALREDPREPEAMETCRNLMRYGGCYDTWYWWDSDGNLHEAHPETVVAAYDQVVAERDSLVEKVKELRTDLSDALDRLL